MSQSAELVQRYIETWNETDAERRRDLIAATWAPDASYLDPMMAGQGREGIDAMIAGVHQAYPGFRFRLAGPVDAHNDRVRFNWELGPEGQAAVAGGVDFGVVADGRLTTVTGFLDFAPV